MVGRVGMDFDAHLRQRQFTPVEPWSCTIRSLLKRIASCNVGLNSLYPGAWHIFVLAVAEGRKHLLLADNLSPLNAILFAAVTC
jgi:hypothetical protein